MNFQTANSQKKNPPEKIKDFKNHDIKKTIMIFVNEFIKLRLKKNSKEIRKKMRKKKDVYKQKTYNIKHKYKNNKKQKFKYSRKNNEFEFFEFFDFINYFINVVNVFASTTHFCCQYSKKNFNKNALFRYFKKIYKFINYASKII